MHRRFMVRLSVIEIASANGPTAIFGNTTTDKILDASVRIGSVQDIRSVIDGLLFEGIPDTQREDEKEDPVVASGGRWVSSPARPTVADLIRDGASGQFTANLPPTVEASGDVEYGGREGPSDFPIKTPIPEGEELKGGKHSGNCSCSGCEPILPGETATIQVPPAMKTRPIKDDPQA